MSNDVRNLTMGELNHIFGGAESCERPRVRSSQYERFRGRNFAGGGGFSATQAVFAGTSYMMLGGMTSSVLPYLGAGTLASAGIALSAAALGAGGAALLAIGVIGLVW